MTDDGITKFAQTYRLEAAAVLVQIAKDESVPAAARQAAAEKILAYSDGRPGTSRPVNVDDVSSLDDDSFERLFHAVNRRIETRQPGFFKTLMREAYLEAIAISKAQALPKPKNRFRRGPLAGAGPEVPRWPPTPPANAIRSDLSAVAGAGRHATPSPPAEAAATPLKTEPPEPCSTHVHGAPDNVVTLPGTRRAPDLASQLSHEADRPPSVSRIAPYRDDSQATPSSSGTIHPSVVARSALKDPLDPFDTWRRS